MSSVEEGWSIEYGDFVDPETAYELFWNDVIRDKQGFICPFCNAKMTCINIDVEEQNWGLKQGVCFLTLNLIVLISLKSEVFHYSIVYDKKRSSQRIKVL